ERLFESLDSSGKLLSADQCLALLEICQSGNFRVGLRQNQALQIRAMLSTLVSVDREIERFYRVRNIALLIELYADVVQGDLIVGPSRDGQTLPHHDGSRNKACDEPPSSFVLKHASPHS